MKNLLIAVTCALCVLIVAAIPMPSAETNQKEAELIQIPLEGNKELDILSLPENAGSQLTERNKRTISVLRGLFPELSLMANSPDGKSSVDMAALSERLQSINRVVRNTAAQTNSAAPTDTASADSNTIATAINTVEPSSSASETSESKAQAIDELSLDDENDDENRNKRFLSFGFGGSNSGAGGGSGGSGNFIFDIIRSTADRAARAAGTIYRVAAGTESFDLNFNKQATRSSDGATTDTDIDNNDSTSRKLTGGLNEIGLIGGSAGTEQTDEVENQPDSEALVKQADGYTEGIPGPVTRLFVLANRGVANLIQDLILRIAQTSERVVNFKARLITSLI